MAKSEEYGLGEFAFPRGWFMIGLADEVTNVPQAIRYFGRDMVVYRGKASGRIIVLDAYCPHMRVHLAKNTTSYVVRDDKHVEGDAIRCPAHGWRYGADGVCNEIPYSTHGIPKAACVKAHQVAEKAGCIWMWHDMEGGEPDFALPEFAEWGKVDEGWVRWEPQDLGTLPIHPQEILDNMTDFGHFAPVHGSNNAAYFENEFDGHIIRQRFGSGHRTLVDTSAMLETDTWYTGPGILLSRLQGKHPSVMMICNTPVEDGEVRVWYALTAKTGTSAPTREEIVIARAYHQSGLDAFSQDFELWEHKQPAINILQIPDDGPFHKQRIWYTQFYNPRAKAVRIQCRVNGVTKTLDNRTTKELVDN